MTALVVQSRFAGLKIEDDDYPSTTDNLKSKKIKNAVVKKTETPKKTKNGNAKSQQGAAKKKKSKINNSPTEQWELWKQKDEVLVDENFETELHQAILLSKLDFEEKKDVYEKIKKETEAEKKVLEQSLRSNNKKQKKKHVMSLDEFNDLMDPNKEQKFNHDVEKEYSQPSESPDNDTEFFERIKDETKDELFKEKMVDRIRHRLSTSDEVITRVQFMDTLEKKDKEITALKQEVTNLKQELLTVKTRNKKLCNILGQGEMKDKAEVLIEVERLRAVQAELTSELAALHTDLEKERSKNTDTKSKDKKHSAKKKNIRFDVSTEVISPKESNSRIK